MAPRKRRGMQRREVGVLYCEVFSSWSVPHADLNAPIEKYVADRQETIIQRLCVPDNLKSRVCLLPFPSPTATVQDFISSGGWVLFVNNGEIELDKDGKGSNSFKKMLERRECSSSQKWVENSPPLLPPAADRLTSASTSSLQVAYTEVELSPLCNQLLWKLKTGDVISNGGFRSQVNESLLKVAGVDTDLVFRCLPDSVRELGKIFSDNSFVICHPADVKSEQCIWKRLMSLQTEIQNEASCSTAGERIDKEISLTSAEHHRELQDGKPVNTEEENLALSEEMDVRKKDNVVVQGDASETVLRECTKDDYTEEYTSFRHCVFKKPNQMQTGKAKEARKMKTETSAQLKNKSYLSQLQSFQSELQSFQCELQSLQAQFQDVHQFEKQEREFEARELKKLEQRLRVLITQVEYEALLVQINATVLVLCDS